MKLKLKVELLAMLWDKAGDCLITELLTSSWNEYGTLRMQSSYAPAHISIIGGYKTSGIAGNLTVKDEGNQQESIAEIHDCSRIAIMGIRHKRRHKTVADMYF